MTITDTIIILVLIVIVGGAIAYIVKTKKSGAKCIGCPHSKTCGSNKKSDTESCCGCETKNK